MGRGGFGWPCRLGRAGGGGSRAGQKGGAAERLLPPRGSGLWRWLRLSWQCTLWRSGGGGGGDVAASSVSWVWWGYGDSVVLGSTASACNKNFDASLLVQDAGFAGVFFIIYFVRRFLVF